MYDLLIRGGEVIDPAQEIHDKRDVGISGGKIAALEDEIAPSEAKKVIDACGKIVTPGLIDAHAHVADTITAVSVPPDEVGVRTGVTTVVDSGSTGCANFAGFREFIISRASTDILCYLHAIPTGQAVLPDVWGWYDLNPEATLKVIDENRDIIKGIKIRANGGVIERFGIEAVKRAKKMASDAGLPLRVHTGVDDRTVDSGKVEAFTRELLSILDEGDTISHIYTPLPGGMIRPDGTVVPGLREAIERGVLLDVAHAIFMFSFNQAKRGLELGILPTTLSTDFSSPNLESVVVLSLAVTMSKFMALGLSLKQVISMTTSNAARMIHDEERRGSLKIGLPADITISEMVEGDFAFYDRREKTTVLKGKYLFEPRLVIRRGEVMEVEFRYRQ